MGCSASQQQQEGAGPSPRIFSSQTSLSQQNLLEESEESIPQVEVSSASPVQKEVRQNDMLSQQRDGKESPITPSSEAVSLEDISSTMSPEELAEHKRRVTVSKLRDELLSSEKTYVHNMQTAMELFMLPLMKLSIIDSDIAADQFNDFIAIAKFNKIILEEFESRPCDMIATLRKYTPGFKLYTSYLQHFERRLHVRATLVHNNALHDFYEKVREQFNNSLESYLVEPVQRIPRYKMLLTELQGKMVPGDDEFDIVYPTVSEVSSMAIHNNEAIREMEKRLEQNEAMMKVVNLTRINVLDDPTRYLLKTTFNLKCTCSGSTMKPLQIWLFNDKIIYGRSVPKKKLFTSTLYTEISLSQCNVVPTPDDEDENESTSFIFESERESFLIIAKTSQEKTEWLDAILQAIEHRRRVSSRSRSGTLISMAPVWKLNDASNVCDICSKQFSVRVRRHHCRLCGSLVCDACSSKRIALVHTGLSHSYQQSSSDLSELSTLELEKRAKKEIDRVKSLQGEASRAQKKERVCTLCYNNLSFQYIQHQGEHGLRLEIKLLSATDLINMDFLSLSDPYVIFSFGNHSLKSRTIDDDLNPVWDTPSDVFCFAYQPKGDWDRKREVSVEMYDEDPTYDDFLGNTVIDLNQFPELDDVSNEYHSSEPVTLDMALQPAGSGRIQLEIKVIQARH